MIHVLVTAINKVLDFSASHIIICFQSMEFTGTSHRPRQVFYSFESRAHTSLDFFRFLLAPPIAVSLFHPLLSST